MIWMAVMRTGAVLSLAAAIMQLYDLQTREVKPNRIYSSGETARYLGMSRHDVVKLVRKNELRGKLVRGNFRISGQSILEYLKQ